MDEGLTIERPIVPAKGVEVKLPHKFIPRNYQRGLFNCLADGFKRALVIWHRRAGKDKTMFNLMICEAMKTVGVYFYLFPTYAQGRKALWDNIDKDGFKVLDHIPKEIIKSKNNTEMKITLTNGSIMQVVGTDNIDCYDDKTEILTESGWKFFCDLEGTERVATLNNGWLEYEPIDKKLEYEYDGDMCHLKSKAIDLLVTPNHKFLVKSRKNVMKFKTISDKTILHDRIPSTCKWEGSSKKQFTLPEIDRHRSDHSENKYQVFDMADWCAFLGIYLSEGSVFSDDRGNYRVIITQCGRAHPVETKEIVELLDRMHLKYNRDEKNFVIPNKQLFEYCKQFGKCHQKYIPKDIKGLAPKYLLILKDWLIKGDGSIQKGQGQESYYSTSKALIDDFQEIIIKLGFSGNIRIKPQGDAWIGGRKIVSKRTLYYLIIRTSEYKYFRNTAASYISTSHYSGKVYCVEVKNHVIKVRRNGFEAWAGNSVVGSNPRGCVFSEFALQIPAAWTLLRPILRENGGWAIFNSTPRRHNHCFVLRNKIRNNDNWYYELLTINDTGVLTEEDIQEDRDEGMSEAMVQQEYYCSFDEATGKLVYNNFDYEAHVSEDPIKYAGGQIIRSTDSSGNTPAAIAFQIPSAGRAQILKEWTTEREGIVDFATRVVTESELLFPGAEFIDYGDPAGGNEFSQAGGGFTSNHALMRQCGMDVIAGESSLTARIQSVDQQLARRDGVLIDAAGCPTLIDGFLGDYHYAEIGNSGTYHNKPNKNWYSHVQDALQHGFGKVFPVVVFNNDDDNYRRGRNRSRDTEAVTGY